MAEGWVEFSQNVSGQWDGHGADFGNEGKPIQLPESAIPDAYREWEVKVFDWQTQCPTLALQVPRFHFSYELIRLYPAVACEVDAPPTYSVLERSVKTDPSTAIAFAYQASGCYVAVWSDQVDSSSSIRVLELEHCLVDPRDRESRVRIIQKVGVYGDRELRMQLEAIQVFCENRNGASTNGVSAFASSPALQSSRISGLWHCIHHASATFQEDMVANIKELVEVEASAPIYCSRDGKSEISLPNQLWCSSNHEPVGETWFQVGWLLDGGVAITSKCIFLCNADFKGIAIRHEKAQI